MLFCFNDTATTEIYTLSLHDALPISGKLAGQYSYSSIYSCAPSASHPSPLPDGLHQTIVLFGRLRRYPEETFIEPFEVRRVTDEHAVFSGKILFQGGRLPDTQPQQHVMRVGGPYFHQPGGGEPFRQTFSFVQQTRDIASVPFSFIEQEMPRLNCQSIDRPRHAMAAYPNDKQFAGGEVSYPQSRNGKLLRHRMNQHHIRHCRRLFHGKQRFEGEVFVRLVDNEQAVGTRQDELFQLPFPANLAGGIVGIANPYQPRLTRQSLRRKERFHPVSVQAARSEERR